MFDNLVPLSDNIIREGWRMTIMVLDPVTAEGWESRITHRAASREEP